ncbi:MAG: hypothetical protein ACR2PP_05235, partial [Psychrobacter sp.]
SVVLGSLQPTKPTVTVSAISVVLTVHFIVYLLATSVAVSLMQLLLFVLSSFPLLSTLALDSILLLMLFPLLLLSIKLL